MPYAALAPLSDSVKKKLGQSQTGYCNKAEAEPLQLNNVAERVGPACQMQLPVCFRSSIVTGTSVLDLVGATPMTTAQHAHAHRVLV